MKSTDAFDRHHLAIDQPVDASGDRIVRDDRISVSTDEPDMRTAVPAGVGLGVEAAIQRVVVLPLAGMAHREGSHRGLRSVVRDAARDGEPRAAIGAVQKWIAIAAIAWVKQFAEAIGASSRVGGNSGAYTSKHLAADYRKARITRDRKVSDAN